MIKRIFLPALIATIGLSMHAADMPTYCTGSTPNNSDGDHYGMSSGSVKVNGATAFEYSTSSSINDLTGSCVATVKPGDIITVRTSGSFHMQWSMGLAYIDWNADGEWSDDETYTLFDNPKNGPSSGSFTATDYQITVPADVTPGSFAMRINVGEAPAYNSLGGDACTARKRGKLATFRIDCVVPTDVERTVSVISSDTSKGTVAIEGATGTSVTKDGVITVIATPGLGYSFTNWTNQATGDIVSTNPTFNYYGADDITLVANFGDLTYPVMKRYFTGSISQQNRYVKEVTTSGTETPVVFSATTKEELPFTYYNTAAGESGAGATENGAVIDKTANPIVITQGTTSFTFTFATWRDPISHNGSTFNSEIGWLNHAYYIDWNRNGSFTDQGEYYTKDNIAVSNSKYSSPTSKTINVPEDIAPGTYRMRLIFNDNSGDWTTSVFNDNRLRNGVAYDFDITITSSNLETPRTVAVASADETLGTVAITDPATDEKSVTTDQKYVTVKATAAETAVFMNWTNENDQVVSSAATYKYSGEADATLTANFGHSVTISAVQYGTLAVTAGDAAVASGDVFVPGTEITVTATPAGGKELKQITINGTPVETTDNAYTFTLNTNTVIEAEFQDVQYRLSVVTEGNGTVTISSDVDENEEPTGDIYSDGSNIPYGGDLYISMVPGEKDGEHETINSVIVTNGEYTIQLSTTDGEQTWTPLYNEYALLTDVSTALYFGGHEELTGIQGNVAVTVAFSNELSAISDIIFDAENGPVEYYNLQGVRVAAENLTPGFYIARQGSKATKILIRK